MKSIILIITITTALFVGTILAHKTKTYFNGLSNQITAITAPDGINR